MASAPRRAEIERHGAAAYSPAEVVIVFTDIEGSTRLRERDRDLVHVAVCLHFDIIGGAIATRGGVH